MVLFVLLLYCPYGELLHRHSKSVAGLLSQLHAEVDVEGHVKTVVLGIAKGDGAQSLNGNNVMALFGPGVMPTGANVMGMMNGAMNSIGMGPAAAQAGGIGMAGAGPAGLGANNAWFGGQYGNVANIPL